MNSSTRLLNSSLGKKTIVALTGLGLVFFIIGHLAGNLSFHAGGDAINTYAEWLHHRPLLVWGARLGILLIVLFHIAFTIRVRLENRAARPERYECAATMRATPSSRIMIWSGLTILAFVIFHLLQFTVLPKVGDPGYFEALKDGSKRHDVYGMIVKGFSNVGVSVFYVIAIGLLCSHLRHGVSSMFQTLGLNSAKVRSFIDKVGVIFAVLVFLGYASIPVSVLMNHSAAAPEKSQISSK